MNQAFGVPCYERSLEKPTYHNGAGQDTDPISSLGSNGNSPLALPLLKENLGNISNEHVAESDTEYILPSKGSRACVVFKPFIWQQTS